MLNNICKQFSFGIQHFCDSFFNSFLRNEPLDKNNFAVEEGSKIWQQNFTSTPGFHKYAIQKSLFATKEERDILEKWYLSLIDSHEGVRPWLFRVERKWRHYYRCKVNGCTKNGARDQFFIQVVSELDEFWPQNLVFITPAVICPIHTCQIYDWLWCSQFQHWLLIAKLAWFL